MRPSLYFFPQPRFLFMALIVRGFFFFFSLFPSFPSLESQSVVDDTFPFSLFFLPFCCGVGLTFLPPFPSSENQQVRLFGTSFSFSRCINPRPPSSACIFKADSFFFPLFSRTRGLSPLSSKPFRFFVSAQ